MQKYIILALIIVIAVLGGLIEIKNLEIGHKNVTIEAQKKSMENLTAANNIMIQNAVAAKKAEESMKKLLANAESLHAIVSNIPDQVKKGLKNEYLERFNHCLGEFYVTGELRSKDCVGTGAAILPVAGQLPVDGGGGKSAK